MKYVIIGNSAAAIGCIEGIRSIDKEGSITVISKETQHTYSRPLISYLLWGKTDLEHMKYRPDDFYEKMNCEVLLGKTVTKIDKDKKAVTLNTRKVIHYDKLLVATGSRPAMPPIPGLDRVRQKFTFMSLDDAKALEAALTPKKKVLIMGAGLIGLKCAEGISHLCGKITVVDLADRILPSILDSEGAALVQSHTEKQGVEFVLSDSVQFFAGNKAVLSSEKEIAFDILVVAVGVRANTELISEIGGGVVRGITTDDRCATTLPDIYAAGDCCESYDVAEDSTRVLALLPNAYMQGEVAGKNMAGGDAVYDKAIAMNAMGMFGYHMVTAGSYTGEEIVSRDKDCYKKLFVRDGYLVGFIIIGDVRRAGIYTKLIRERVPLCDIDFELIADKPQLMAFAGKERRKQLGTVR